jgi:polyisoprenoid-binding protein YceI
MTSQSAPSIWNIDPAHSSAEFKVRHMMISFVRGEFSGLSGTLKLDASDYTRSEVEVSIPATTIRTGDDRRDAHLKNEEFFDGAKFPELKFRSTHIESKGGLNYSVLGDLTIRGISHAVDLNIEDLSAPANDPWGHQRIGLSASTKVNRKDSGLKWNVTLEAGGVLVDVKSRLPWMCSSSTINMTSLILRRALALSILKLVRLIPLALANLRLRCCSASRTGIWN